MSNLIDNKSPKLDIIMFNMSAYSEWQAGYVNRNSQVLRELLADERVRKIVAVDYLPFTFRRSLKAWLLDVLRGPRGKTLSHSFTSRLTALSQGEINQTVNGSAAGGDEVPYRLFVYSTILSWRSERLALGDLARRLAKLNLKNVVLWSYLPTFAGYFEALPHRLSVFEAVDNWLEHSAYRHLRERLRLNYQTIRYKADLIFATAEEMVRFFDRPRDIYYLPNGIRLEHFQNPPKLVGRDIASLPRPIIGYLGIIQEDKFDLELVYHLAQSNPGKSFVFVGPLWATFRKRVEAKLGNLPNVHFLGRKHYREVPSYVNQFDVGIVPHLVNEFGKHTNPLKVLEYLACGKPVVATPTAGIDAFLGVVTSASSPEAFNQAILEALQYDSEAKREARRRVAARHTWRQRVDFILEKVMARMNG